MGRITISFGIALFFIGLIGYFATGMASWTALIPSIIGLLIGMCGALAMREPIRKHAMHAAVLIAALALIAVLGRMIPTMMDGTFNAAVIEQLITAIVLIVFVVLCVKSFVDARRAQA